MNNVVVWACIALIAFLVGLDLGVSKKWAECPPRNGQDPLVSSIRRMNGDVVCNYVASITGRATYSFKRTIQ